jgi:hypothetical protein
MNYFRNLGQKGSALALSILVLGSAVAGSMYIYKKFNKLEQQAASRIKDLRIIPIREKISRLGGFLIASNFILCKSNTWTNGQEEMSCGWNRVNSEGSDKDYGPEDFGLTAIGEGLEDGYLKFSVKAEELFSENKGLLKNKNSWIKFKLRSKDELQTSLDGENSINDQDQFLIEMQGQIEYAGENGKSQIAQLKTVFRRPIAVPHIALTASSCVERCDVSISENPSPACRSPHYTDPETMTTVDGTIKNLGPGALYKLGYERSMVYAPGVSPIDSNATGIEEVIINIGDSFIANKKVTWADTFPCGYSQGQESEIVIVKNDNELSDIFKDFNISSIIIPLANAQWVNQLVGTTTSVSQHSYSSGSVSYSLNPTSDNAVIEPFKMTQSLVGIQGEDVQGIQDVTTITQVYKRVWVSPPH